MSDQQAVMQGQLDEMQAEQRPWVSVSAEIGPKGLYYDVNGVNLDIKYVLKNTGSTPASMVQIEGSPRIDVGISGAVAELDKISAKAIASPPDPRDVGFTIFPGETFIMDSDYSFASSSELANRSAKYKGFISPVLIGDVVYYSPTKGSAPHQSRFIYTFDEDRGIGGAFAIDVARGNMLTGQLRMQKWIEVGSFSAD